MAVTEARVVQIESQVEEHGNMLGSLRDDIVRLEERMDRRFDAVDRRFDSFERKMDRRFDAIDAKMSRQFMWLAGMMVTTLAAMLASVLAR